MKSDSLQYAEALSQKLTEHAETQRAGERVIDTLFTPQEAHGGKDAPGWCKKTARKLMSRANKIEKNFQNKQRERRKPRHERHRQSNQLNDTIH